MISKLEIVISFLVTHVVATIVQGNLDDPKDVFQIKDRELVTQFSNNIRSDFSYMNRTDDLNRVDEVMFRQNGRSVFKEVCPMVVEMISINLQNLNLILMILKDSGYIKQMEI